MGGAPGQRLVDIGGNLVAIAADRRAKVGYDIGGGSAKALQGVHSPSEDAGYGTSPTSVEECDGPGRVREKDRDTVRDGDGKRGPALGGSVAVGGVRSKPASPTRAVRDHACAVHLCGGRQA